MVIVVNVLGLIDEGNLKMEKSLGVKVPIYDIFCIRLFSVYLLLNFLTTFAFVAFAALYSFDIISSPFQDGGLGIAGNLLKLFMGVIALFQIIALLTGLLYSVKGAFFDKSRLKKDQIDRLRIALMVIVVPFFVSPVISFILKNIPLFTNGSPNDSYTFLVVSLYLLSLIVSVIQLYILMFMNNAYFKKNLFKLGA